MGTQEIMSAILGGFAVLGLALAWCAPAGAAEPITGSVTVHPGEVVNPSIMGAGVNFAFSDYVYVNFETGEEWTDIRSRHMPDPDDDAGWERFTALMDFAGFQYVRLCVGVNQWEPVNDNDDPHSLNLDDGFVFSAGFAEKHPEGFANNLLYMKAMHRLLDYFERRGLYVILGNWWAGPDTFCPDQHNWMLARDDEGNPVDFRKKGAPPVADIEEFTESLAAILVHLKKEKGYDCVKGISFWNEPEHMPDYHETLAAVYRSLGAQLERHGIRDKVKIQAFDGAVFWTAESSGVPDGVSRLMAMAGDHIDIISFHDYFSKLEYQRDETFTNVHGTISDFTIGRTLLPAIGQARRADGTALPVVAGEYGSFAFVDERSELTPADFGQRLHNAAATTQLLNHGCKAVAYWIYNNNYHEHFRMLTFDTDDPERFVPDPVNYYPLALTMKHIPQGADIVRSEIAGLTDADGIPRVYVTAAVKGDDTTLLWVNDAPQPARVEINGLEPGTVFRQWHVDADTCDRITRADDWTPGAPLDLRPRSITVLTTQEHGSEKVPD